jgi:hypothetical protein
MRASAAAVYSLCAFIQPCVAGALMSSRSRYGSCTVVPKKASGMSRAGGAPGAAGSVETGACVHAAAHSAANKTTALDRARRQ